MKVNIASAEGKSSTSLQVSDDVFDKAYNENLIHQVLTAYMVRGRAGTHKTKSRADVRGGGAKPWRQKGTGRARAGTSSSPIWRGGGMTFAKRPRKFDQKVNKKMYRAAMRSIWSELVRQERLVAVEGFELQAPKTKQLVEKMKTFGVDRGLIVLPEDDDNIRLASRNIPYVDVCTASEVSPYDLIAYDKVMVFTDALKKIEETLQ